MVAPFEDFSVQLRHASRDVSETGCDRVHFDLFHHRPAHSVHQLGIVTAAELGLVQHVIASHDCEADALVKALSQCPLVDGPERRDERIYPDEP